MKRFRSKNLKKWKKSREIGPYAKIDWEKASVLFQKPIKQKLDKQKIPPVKDILRILAIAGVVGLVFAFPGAAPAIGALFLGDKSYNRWGSKKVISKLERQKYVKVKEREDGSVTVTITKKGMTRALTYQLDEMKLNVPKKWDRK